MKLGTSRYPCGPASRARGGWLTLTLGAALVANLAAGLEVGCSSGDQSLNRGVGGGGNAGGNSAGGTSSDAATTDAPGNTVTLPDGAVVTLGDGSFAVTLPDGAITTISNVACDSTRPCTQIGTVCASGFCVPTLGACTSDSNCQGDSYCCLGACAAADPGASGQCVPFTGQNQACAGVSIGVFSPSLQCQWTAPPAGDPYPTLTHVLTSPLVADLPNDSGASAEIIIVASDKADGGTSASNAVIRILSGQTCAQDEVITDSYGVRDQGPPAIADLDRDGKLDIVARMQDGTVAAFHWDNAQGKFVKWWSHTAPRDTDPKHPWAGVSLHDLDNDGYPEVVIEGGFVFDGRTGAPLNQSGVGFTGDPVLGDVDADGNVELIASAVFRWDTATKSWSQAYPGASGNGKFYAFADFGTPGATAADFNPKALDGIAEVVAAGNNMAGIYTLAGQEILRVALAAGGPPTVGDYDRDGFPEIAVADAVFFRVIDLDCKGAPAGCAANYIRWAQASQDFTSKETGSTTFDFEGDGAAEAVYADECFLRVYEGSTGSVLYSAYRRSCTWWEFPVVADVDKDTRTEIVVNSNPNCNVVCPDLDPIHPGVRCLDNSDCFSKQCDSGFCRCSTNADCGELSPDAPGGLKCVAPLGGTPGNGNVCRMQHPGAQVDPESAYVGVRVLRDRLDRWADSRPLWNQHAYSITNINDDGTVPASSQWKQNFLQPGLNNFRANVQGPGSVSMPDITGALNKDEICRLSGGTVTLNARVCNRGFRVVGADMPATFYLGPVTDNNILCVSYTNGPVPVGDACLPVSCQVNGSVPVGSTVTMVVNDDGQGHATTVECNSNNNTDSILIEQCPVIQ